MQFGVGAGHSAQNSPADPGETNHSDLATFNVSALFNDLDIRKKDKISIRENTDVFIQKFPNHGDLEENALNKDNTQGLSLDPIKVKANVTGKQKVVETTEDRQGWSGGPASLTVSPSKGGVAEGVGEFTEVGAGTGAGVDSEKRLVRVGPGKRSHFYPVKTMHQSQQEETRTEISVMERMHTPVSPILLSSQGSLTNNPRRNYYPVHDNKHVIHNSGNLRIYPKLAKTAQSRRQQRNLDINENIISVMEDDISGEAEDSLVPLILLATALIVLLLGIFALRKYFSDHSDEQIYWVYSED